MRNLIHVLFVLFSFIVFSCEEKQDNEVWPPNYSAEEPRPVITKIYPDPATSDQNAVSFAGVGIVYIEGQNFSSTVNGNRVHFDGKLGETLEASTTLLKVRMSNVWGDSVKVHVNSAGAILYADYNGQHYYSPFRAKNAVPTYFAIDQDIDVSGLAVDANENVYVLTLEKKILKISHPDSPAVEYGDAIFIVTPCMRIGPDSLIYMTRGTKSLYTVAEGGKTKKLISYNNNVAQIDFDENKNLFAGGKGETLEVLKNSDGTDETVAEYPGYTITALRVYDGYVYAAMKYNRLPGVDIDYDSTAVLEEIWRNQILDVDGNLGPNEHVFNWSGFVGENGPEILSLTFDESGEMYIGQSRDEAIYMLNAGTYFYPQILDAPVTSLTWGNGNFLYINKHSDDPTVRTLVRVETTINGAIYYGR
ncbi:MAG: IPT/TIG domain-containing protein [Calditrichaeota bacterium]|nr:IPT/TIG domain-containing protein [Calditrichota bacterium]